jgi:cellulose biosynthesis protein BcsQ
MGNRYGVLLNQVQAAATARTRAWVEIYDSRSLIIDPVWVSRVAYQDAIAQGLGVMELAPASLAAQEVQHAWLWIANRLLLAGEGHV